MFMTWPAAFAVVFDTVSSVVQERVSVLGLLIIYVFNTGSTTCISMLN